jgi:hypothetical protein
MYHAWDEKCVKKFWSENLKGGDHAKDLGVDGRVILEWILGKQGGKVWTGCIWLSLGARVGFLRTQ